MDFKEEINIKSRVPVFTLFVTAGAILSYFSNDLASLLVYDRGAILNGEVWRLLTSNLVHHNTGHLLYDLLAFCLAGWLLESKGFRHFWLLCISMALVIGIFLLSVKTGMAYYGGLSGIACGSFVYLALTGLREKGMWRVLCLMALIFIPVKIYLESISNGSILYYSSQSSFVTIWEAHAVGSAVALIVFVLQKIYNGRLIEQKRFKDKDNLVLSMQ